MFLQLLVGGIAVGCIYALIGLGYSLIYSASGLMSFVQGEIFMLGAYVAFTIYVGCKIPFIFAVFIAIAIMFVFGMLMERSMISPLLKRGAGQIHIVIATIGLSIFLKNFAMIVWGTDVKNFPSVFGEFPYQIGVVSISPQQLVIMLVTIVCMILLHLFMNKTRMGTSLRAAAQDPMAAGVVGINVPFTVGMAWALAAVLSAIAGILLAPIYGVYPKMGAILSTKGFAAAVLGGYGNMYGAIIGGLIVGVVETMAAGYLSSSFKDIISFGVLIVVLFVMPHGILKVKAD
ncbi:branched-chain amino acid ABC transporter permease [Agathobaculum sp. NSJ-28]|uniref:Branched-chain amino acid ABC transporter permease n=2 Tax=Agathobaculum TaxID=2048137 RepID=A0A923LX12_9FIRM|nr:MULTISPECIES: branched-chain amino acid ABC transporter permease [Agathobaculum]MBC5726744.1 branched-chain amino acid ABC transporter permease [Agathobaculum faecis]MCU6789899.1 branched-chain amino acid ABC transporter permease [Agathobaculum ammoniilyticum]SCJ42726.1 LIV-I protein H [uncultured Butyricicoccus sp.]